MQIMSTTLALAAVLAVLLGGPSAPRPEARHQSPAPPQATPAAGHPARLALRDGGPVHGVPQQPGVAVGPRHLDRLRVAVVDDGQRRARPVLAGGRAARSSRPPGGRRGDPARVLRLPHADDALRGEGERAARAGLRAPPHLDGRRTPDRDRPGGRRRLVHRLPPGRQGEARHQGQLQRRVRRRSHARAGPAPRVRPLPGRQRAHARHAVGVHLLADRGRAHPVVRGVRHVPYPVHAHAGAWGKGDWRVARAGAVPRMAAQRLREGAELSGVPHAGRDWRGGHLLGGGRAATRTWRATSSAAATSSCR